VREARLKVTETILAYEKRRTSGQDLLGVVELDLPPIHFETIGIWIEIPDNVKHAVETANLNFMGGIHAAEHAAISMFPLFALCDRDDIGGISTPYHLQVGKAAIFIYDGYPGGVGLAHRAFDVIEDLLNKTRALVAQCPCVDGCPSCIHSPKCGSGNKPLDKKACGVILDLLLEPEKTIAAKQRRIMKRPVIFPHLAADRNRGQLGHQAAKSHPPEGGPLHPTADTIGATDESINRAVKTEEATMTTRQGERITEIRPLEPELRNRTLPRSAPTVRILTDRPKGVVVFDLETQKLAHEVGGWKNISLMGLALGVAHTEQDGYLTFTEDNVSDLIALLRQASLIVGFNHVRFDYEVLRPYTNENLRALPNLDIFEHVEAALGHRLSLGQLAQYTLGATKSGSGLDAARWFREGRMDLLEQYCRDDVRITRDLYLYGVEKKFLLYKRRTSRIGKIPVDWPSPRRQ
jgi:DEAD/DEAH box helicase domain-containing protein